MFIYSKNIVLFIQQIKSQIKRILTQEIGLRVHGDRFYDRSGRCSYPIKVAIYSHKNRLGHFDPDFYELGFNRRLMLVSQEDLKNIIRHELAHYLVYIEMGGGVPPHGAEFREFCRKRGWDEKVYQATSCLEEVSESLPVLESSVLRKIQKLMSLSSSSNKYEAEQAMIKSQQLLLKHNLNSEYLSEEESMVLKRILKQKRECGKMQAIARIMETFFVSVVYSRSQEYTCLEILGTEVNVEIADYMASILQRELDTLWIKNGPALGLKGLVAKNSFFRGVAKGYCDKIQFLKRDYNFETTKALALLETKLDEARAMVYGRLSSRSGRRGHCRGAAELGERIGQQLTLNPGLNRAKNSLLLLE